MIGPKVGHYRIIEKLGEGGMGEVYLAEDTLLGRRIALKVLSSEKADDPEGHHFITMELVEGGTLGELIPNTGFPGRG